MSDFKNVSIVKKANVYYGGKVTSRTVLFSDGTKKTLGFMQAGEYEFGTADRELMEVLGGSMLVKFTYDGEWKCFNEGDSYYVDANSKFWLNIEEHADYCCSYIKS